MTEPLAPPAERPARILIVDDEPLNVDYLEQELEAHGFLTTTAGNGLEALERVAAEPPDLVLLDVMMPAMDGISALRILKGDPETRLIPVVLMTALTAVEDRVRGIEAGADDFLSKPVDDRELLARITTALRLKRAIDETVGELRNTSAYLERYGRRERDVTVLAVEWRPRDASLPAEAAGFLGRGRRAAAEERIRALGGTPSESDASVLVAVFEGPDPASRSLAAVEAALAVIEADRDARSTANALSVQAGVSAGPAQVGSVRVRGAGELRWAYGAEGEPVERARGLARVAADAVVLVAESVAVAVGDRFRLSPNDESGYRVLALADPDGEATGDGSAERAVKTIVITDIVDSTRVVERLGDHAWSDLLARHDRAIRSRLVLHAGEELDTTGDGFVATFDSPAHAIQCALAAIEDIEALGLTIRAGAHTGEVEQVDGTLRGIALHVASRIAERAGSSELLVSATTRELVAGAGLVFVDRGEHLLKGVAEPRRLYAVAQGRSSVSDDVSPGPRGRP
jgi:DNA-binding response OmpR family regulator